jgi:ABC-2 type transport system ATP-binding protein
MQLMARDCGGDCTLDEHTRRITVPAAGGVQTLVQVVRDLGEARIRLDDVGLRRPTLDDVFLTLTGHAAEEPVSDEAPTSDERGRRRGAA